jgi:hypothetical protein
MICLGVNNRVFSILVICLLILSALLVFVSYDPILVKVSAASFSDSTDTDFKKGQLNNVEILGTGVNAKIVLKSNKNGNWTLKLNGSTPDSRRGHVISSIHGTDKVLLFGGYKGGNYYNDTWVYDLSNNSWTQMKPNTIPGGRHSHAMSTIYGTDKVLMFGGYKSGGLNSETWVYDLSDDNWIDQKPNGSKPHVREYHAMASIFDDDKVVLFGGCYSTLYYNGTWVYDLNLNNWTKKSPQTYPTGRKGHEMANIYHSKEIILFGGNETGTKLVNDTWIYNLTSDSWTKKSPTGNIPSARRGHGMAAIYGKKEVMIFGPDDSTYVYDTNINSWTKKSPATKPKGRYICHGIASIDGKDKAMLFSGGYNSGGWKHLSDTWLFDASAYVKTGTYISLAHNTITNNTLKQIKWNSSTPTETNLKFQFRSASSKSGLNSKSFVGPNGSTLKYYQASPSTIWSGHAKDQWIQYKAFLSSTNEDQSPKLKDVTITYSNLKKPNNVGPLNNTILSSNTPTFSWENTARLKYEQTGFQVLIALDQNFYSIQYDSGEQSSTDPIWEFPMGTNYEYIEDGTWYWKVRTRAANGYWGYYSDPFVFTIDTFNPTSEISYPVNNGFYNELKSITGTAMDSEYIWDSGTSTSLDRVEIIIQRESDNYYWNGINWKAVYTILKANGKNEWEYDTELITWTTGIEYTIKSWAVDIVNNYQVPPDTVKFLYETEKPNSSIENPKDDVWINKLESIYGVASDIGGSEVSKVEISIECWERGKSWDGSSWTNSIKWLEANGQGIWSYDTNDIDWETGFSYFINSRAIDLAGNIQGSSDEIRFIFDDESPECEIKINNDEKFTKSTQVTVAIHAEDNGAGPELMAFSFDNNQWTAWETFSLVKKLELPTSDGKKTIFCNVQDGAGNKLVTPEFDTIILDTTAPTDLLIVINDGATETDSRSVTLTLNANDASDELDQMSIRNDGEPWGSWVPFNSEIDFILREDDGEKTIYFKVKDKAGNEAEPVTATIILQTEQLDTDMDGIPDVDDAFPTDPAAAIDTDGDKYPDAWNPGKSKKDSTTGLELDEYPNNPRMYKRSDEQGQSSLTIFTISILLFVIIIILFLTFTIVRKYRPKSIDPTSNDEILDVLKQEVLTGENNDDLNITKHDLKSIYHQNYQDRELSKDTDEFVENLLEDTD